MGTLFCPHCKVNSSFRDPGANLVARGVRHAIVTCDTCGGGVFILQDRIVYPEVRSEAPDEYPQDVRDNYSEALRSLNGNNPKAAVIMARSALQAATREHGAQGANLKQEIDYLADNHVIPVALQEWAHELRDGGNLVGHPEPGQAVDMADAEELIELADSVFEYLYVIPKHVERRRDRLAEKLKQQQAEAE